MTRATLSSVLYLVLLGIHLYAGQFSDWSFEAIGLSKVLLLIYLLSWWLVLWPFWKRFIFGKLITLALLCSLAGDALLLFQDDNGDFFLLGLAAFLVAHLAYLIAFLRTYRQDHEEALLRKQGWLLVIVVGYGVFFFGKLAPGLGDLMAYVMLYTLIITVMLLIALSRWGKVSPASFYWIAIGAALFVASDSVLAFNKFIHKLTYAHLLIMATYGLAQWAIFQGARLQVLEQHALSKQSV